MMVQVKYDGKKQQARDGTNSKNKEYARHI